MRSFVQVFYDSKYGGVPPFAPRRNGDVGYDLHVRVDPESQSWFDKVLSLVVGRPCMIIWPIVGVKTIHSGFHLVMPNEIWCEIRPRSSTAKKKLHVVGGTIDSGYMGPLFTVLHNFGFMPRLIIEGQRYAQAVFRSAIRPEINFIDEEHFADVLAFSRAAGGRGAQGFGSSGQ